MNFPYPLLHFFHHTKHSASCSWILLNFLRGRPYCFPRCGAAVYEGKKNFYCSDRACSFVMWKNDRFFEQRKKAFTKAIAAALLKDGKVKIKGMYSTKTGKTFDGVVLLADTGGKYVNFRVEQNRK